MVYTPTIYVMTGMLYDWYNHTHTQKKNPSGNQSEKYGSRWIRVPQSARTPFMADRKSSLFQLLLIENMSKTPVFSETYCFNNGNSCDMLSSWLVTSPVFDVFGPIFSGSKCPCLTSCRCLCTAAGTDLLGGANGSNTHTWDRQPK